MVKGGVFSSHKEDFFPLQIRSFDWLLSPKTGRKQMSLKSKRPCLFALSSLIDPADPTDPTSSSPASLTLITPPPPSPRAALLQLDRPCLSLWDTWPASCRACRLCNEDSTASPFPGDESELSQ